MSVTVVGSVAFDSVTTPFGSVEDELGGSAVYASLAAAISTQTAIVAPVGEDFGREHYEVLAARGVETTGLEHHPGHQTFTWRGRYGYDMSTAHTEETHLNVFDGWRPKLPEAAAESDILFLASMDPAVQIQVRKQWRGGKWAALDTIGYWIETRRDALIAAIENVDIVLMNDQEARALTRRPMLLHAAREIASWGPKAVVLKHGEYGCSLLTRNGYFALPGYPLEALADPTGSGDAFAGGMLGLLDLVPSTELTEAMLRRALTNGAVIASFCVEAFGPSRIARLAETEVNARVEDFKRMTHFEHVDLRERRRAGAHDPAGRSLPMPGPTGGNRGYAEPDHTGGTPSYDAPGAGRGTPRYDRPDGTPSIEPQDRPRPGR